MTDKKEPKDHMNDDSINKVSVIIPVYRSENTLEKCVDSVLSQDHENVEILLVQNGEDEDSASCRLCRELEIKYDIVTLIHSDKGVSAARNKGMETAAGKYICFLDSDDELLPGSISMMVRTAERDNSSLVIAGHERDEAGKKIIYAD